MKSPISRITLTVGEDGIARGKAQKPTNHQEAVQWTAVRTRRQEQTHSLDPGYFAKSQHDFLMNYT